MKRAGAFVAAAIALVLVASSGVGGRGVAWAAATPFFMFAATGSMSSVGSVLDRYVRPGDYLSAGIVSQDPGLASRIGRSNTFTLPPSLRHAVCTSDAGLVMYDGEHWTDTPPDEQADMPGAIARGKSMVKSGGCAYGVAPDGIYVGLIPKQCNYDIDNAIHRQVDWDDIDLFNIQAQRLLSDQCAAQGGAQKYVAFVSQVAREVKAKNPHTKVSAQFSLRYSPPDRIISAINQLRGVVDGFYIAYPAKGACAYCTPQNLGQVLAALR